MSSIFDSYEPPVTTSPSGSTTPWYAVCAVPTRIPPAASAAFSHQCFDRLDFFGADGFDGSRLS